MEQSKSVLIMGGSGQAGAGAAAMLRRWHPALPLTIGGRDLGRARRVADELGNATAVTIELQRSDLGLPPDHGYSAVVAALWDERLHGLHYAQHRGLPYLSISSSLVDIAPEVVAGAQRAGAAPILVASHYFAGLVVLATLDSAREFDRIDTIRIGAVLDEQDTGGPSAIADLQRWSAVTSAGLVRRDGVFTWVTDSDAEVGVLSVDGTVLPSQSIAILDVPSLALATGAPNVRFDFAVGESASRRRGEPASTEVRIDIEGTGPAGAPLSSSRYLVHAAGQRPLTALGVALGVERLLGLRGEAVAPGIHTPEALLDPAYAVEQMAEIGTTFVGAPGGAG
ncbi:saccharopine dehydrogenase [Nocardia sp. NBC_00508]|uniref:saccharopine dehydrogenase n=1 Tax=Nocardia sp. NBC_00508 TaxID=2975992 RepID=UPI002E82064F|nr:saccharopine dehydrogenase [Nocardia sp. NBC_00508]WUD66244.1 saccharopine dehydrogenase [Nocardia sp. NBC_00508]